MDEKKAVSLEELRLKLEHLKDLDQKLQVFGAKCHYYKSYPVSNEDLITLESKLGVRLPEDYRHFLQVIGFGAGPYYGLASPYQILAELKDSNVPWEERFPVPSQPFPFTIEQAEECWRKMGEHQNGAVVTEYPTDGCIPICFEGCCFWTYIVTAGNLTGSLWSYNKDLYNEKVDGSYKDAWNLAPEPPSIISLDYKNSNPLLPVWESALSPLPTFLEWYCAWIDRCLWAVEELKREQSDGPSAGTGESAAGFGQSVASKNEFRIFKSIVNLFRFKGKSG